jgi:hypothetical protein
MQSGHIAKFIVRREGSNGPTVIRSHLGLKFLPLVKTTAIAESLENQVSQHALCSENHERQVVNRV